MTSFWDELKKPIIGLVPMDGITDEPMRQIQCQIAKPDVIYTEFVSVEGFVRKPEIFKKKLTFKENERPIIAQVFGETPEDFYQAVKQICLLGFDGVDINMGCSAKSVVNRGGGGALIGNYNLSEKIIKQCLEAIKDSSRGTSLSIKTRIGCRGVTTKDWFDFLSQFPLAEITVHGRALKQANSGPVNWEEIKIARQILEERKILCLGNGDIRSVDEAKDKCRVYVLDGILIGQAALGNPWIFKENYRPKKEEILKTILSHGELAWNFYGEKGYLTVLKHFGWYPRGFSGSKELKRQLLQTRKFSEVEKIILDIRGDKNRQKDGLT